MLEIEISCILWEFDFPEVFSGIMNGEKRVFVFVDLDDDHYNEFISVPIDDDLVERLDMGATTLREAFEGKEVLSLRWRGNGDNKIIKNVDIISTGTLSEKENELDILNWKRNRKRLGILDCRFIDPHL